MADSPIFQVTTPGEREIVVTRVLDAPRRLVFDALTKPELLKRWMEGPQGWSLAVCEMDLKAGGRFRYVWRRADGGDMGMGGVMLEVVPPERLVHKEVFDEDWTGGETIVTTTFVEKAGKTILTITVLYSSREARDGALKTGMTEGMKAGYDKLAQVLAENQGKPS